MFIPECSIGDIRGSITIMQIRKFLKMYHKCDSVFLNSYSKRSVDKSI